MNTVSFSQVNIRYLVDPSLFPSCPPLSHFEGMGDATLSRGQTVFFELFETSHNKKLVHQIRLPYHPRIQTENDVWVTVCAIFFNLFHVLYFTPTAFLPSRQETRKCDWERRGECRWVGESHANTSFLVSFVRANNLGENRLSRNVR